MRTVHLNMTMSLDGFVAGPNGELDWMTTARDAELTADIVALLRRADEAFMGYLTAAGMIGYWAGVAHDPDASPAPRAIAHAVSGTHTFAISRSPEQFDVPNAEVVVAPDDTALTAAVTEIKQRPGRDLGLPGGVRTARTFSRLGLIDRYVLLIEPIALGTGQRLFDQRTPLTLVGAKTYECGITRLIYQPTRSPKSQLASEPVSAQPESRTASGTAIGDVAPAPECLRHDHSRPQGSLTAR